MATQQEEVESVLEISGLELATAIADTLATSADFIKALCNSPAFIAALTSNKQFCAAIAKKAGAAAGPALTTGLGR
jgi:hypothetical protein